eukprot:5189264-Pleurochrysis_carterae.AAC.1
MPWRADQARGRHVVVRDEQVAKIGSTYARRRSMSIRSRRAQARRAFGMLNPDAAWDAPERVGGQ